MISPPAETSDASSRLALVRTRLSFERTMLSWIRTATALITFGFGVHQVFRVAPGAGHEELRQTAPIAFGTIMVGIGLAALVLAALDHRAATRALERDYPATAGYPPATRSHARILGALIGLLGICALVLMHIGP